MMIINHKSQEKAFKKLMSLKEFPTFEDFVNQEINNTSKNTILVYRYVVHDSEFKDGHKINDILVIPESVYFEKYHTSELHNCIIAVGSGSIRQKIVNKITVTEIIAIGISKVVNMTLDILNNNGFKLNT